MGRSGAERQREWRKRRVGEGRKAYNIYLDPDTAQALEEVKKDGETTAETITRAIWILKYLPCQ